MGSSIEQKSEVFKWWPKPVIPAYMETNRWGNHYQLKRDTHNTRSCQVKTTRPRPVAPRSNNRSVDRPLSTLVLFVLVLVENFIG